MRRLLLTMLLFSFLPLVSPDASAAGIQIGRTRIIYLANKKEVALPVINKESEMPWLVQSWVDNGDGKTRAPFIITPPLFRLDPLKEQSLRIIRSGGNMAQDRESLFYANVRTIPALAKDTQDKNVLRLIYKTRLKLFYRPVGLSGTPDDACSHLQFTRTGATLQVNNRSAYYTVFDSLSLGSTPIPKADMLAPFTQISLPLPEKTSASKDIAWRCISDYGNATEKFSTHLDTGS
ncbi:fimbrial biogenesis chaperone [Citrobacter amalonaticus]|uniref:fimbrial biogenesis chaperone n=1 Tax=Citrobacter amalonaticus TaxID=35703 RepID=UPI00255B3D93|nr:molecular chaperone [Citrobacter amalonaticus]MDL4618946.1 molecular chaperone [Citrobacter amalonaticus]MDL4623044.1 molecular chaperone [Citrobacter amalonaticus]